MRALESRNIVLASHNKGKLREISSLLEPYGFAVTSAAEHGLPEPLEDGDSFEANAYIKAHAAAVATRLVALSDDSGLCAEALGGAPGIHTADWAEKDDGSGRDFTFAMRKVEDRLQDAGATAPSRRRAYFCAVLCLCWPDGHAEYFRGEAHGELVWPPRGDKGFGYDPVFQPDGYQRTFGEMTEDEKHGSLSGHDKGLSHRARAFTKFAEALLPQAS